MKKLSLILGSILLFIGCSHQPTKEPCIIENTKAPNWICYPPENAGVGEAEKSPLGFNFQRQEAIANARDDLSRKIKVKIKNMIKKYYSSTGVKNNQTVERVVTDVSKQITNNVIRNSKVEKFWISPKGNLYILVSCDINQTENEIKTTFHNDEALWQEYKAEKQFEDLEKETK